MPQDASTLHILRPTAEERETERLGLEAVCRLHKHVDKHVANRKLEEDMRESLNHALSGLLAFDGAMDRVGVIA